MAQRAPPSLQRQLSLSDNDEIKVPDLHPTHPPPDALDGAAPTPQPDIVEEEEEEKRDNAPNKGVTVVQGGVKGGLDQPVRDKVYGRWFPAVRKLAAWERGDHDSVVRVSLAELFIFLVCLACMMTYTFGRRSETEYYFTQVHKSLFTETDSNGDDNVFTDINTQADFWVYMENEFVNAVYWEEWYNGDTPFPYQGYVFGESKVLGRLQLRQVRVKEGTCKVHEQFQSLISECYDSYTTAGEEKGPIAVSSGNATMAWKSEDETGYRAHPGQVAKYAGSGYIVTLGETKAEALATIQDLKESLWIDRSTRAVFADLNLYNANLNLFLIIRIMAEFPPTGGVVVSSEFKNVKLLRYHSTSDLIYGGFECAYALFILYYLVEMVFTGIYLGKRKMIFRFWTWYDALNFGLGITYLAFSLKSYLDVTGTLSGLIEDQSKYLDFEELAYSAEIFREMNGINIFLSCVKVFKFMNFTKTMSELQATLVNSAGDLIGFTFMVMVVLTAYAQCGYLIFGAQLRDFSTFTDALFTLFRIILGDFDFVGLEKAHRYMGPIYFITFVLVVFFVMLNMFLAIIADTYSEVKGDGKYGQQGKIFGQYFKKLGSQLHIKLKKLEKLEESLRTADTNHDNFINMEELEKAVGAENARELMRKFDMSKDQRISIHEKDRMMATLVAEREKTTELITETEKREGNLTLGIGNMPALADMEDFDRLSNRVHRLERSLGTIASRITAMVNKMEKIERARSRSETQQLMKKRVEKIKTEEDPDNYESSMEI